MIAYLYIPSGGHMTLEDGTKAIEERKTGSGRPEICTWTVTVRALIR